MSLEPEPSAQTIVPPAPTATDAPGRFCSSMAACTRPCARSTAADIAAPAANRDPMTRGLVGVQRCSDSGRMNQEPGERRGDDTDREDLTVRAADPGSVSAHRLEAEDHAEGHQQDADARGAESREAGVIFVAT